MIYSEWKPDTGGFIYYEANEAQNINDDLPAPELRAASKIGVPSIEAGRPLPSGARVVGEGDVAVGMIAPVNPSRIVRRTRSLAGVAEAMQMQSVWVGIGAATILVWWVWKSNR